MNRGRGQDEREQPLQQGAVDAAGGQTETQGKAKDGKKIYSTVWEYVKIMVFACVAALLLDRLVIINAVIPSESMEKLLMVGDRVFGFRLAYVLDGPDRYDVVMFKYPVDEETIYIKRVIGLPGETVEIKEGKIYIDGAKTPIEEDYLPEDWVDRNNGYIFHVPQDCYLMMGDNRNISEDARDWAQCAIDADVVSDKEEAEAYTYVHADKIIGRAVMKYYPKIDIFFNF